MHLSVTKPNYGPGLGYRKKSHEDKIQILSSWDFFLHGILSSWDFIRIPPAMAWSIVRHKVGALVRLYRGHHNIYPLISSFIAYILVTMDILSNIDYGPHTTVLTLYALTGRIRPVLPNFQF